MPAPFVPRGTTWSPIDSAHVPTYSEGGMCAVGRRGRHAGSGGCRAVWQQRDQLVPDRADRGIGEELRVMRDHDGKPLTALRNVQVGGVGGFLQPLVDPVGARTAAP